MSQNIVTQRLVNATNILFHLMDLQPYALVLPMDGKSANRNKRKIMQKILANNRPQKSTSEEKKVKIEKQKAAINNRLNHDYEDDEEAGNADESGTESQNTVTSHTGSVDSGKKDFEDRNEETNESLTPASTENSSPPAKAKGRPKKSKNDTISSEIKTDLVITDQDYEIPLDDENSPFYSVRSVVDRLDSDDMKGCIIMLAAKTESYFGVVPLAGGIIEIYDEHERCIPAMWVNRSLQQRADLHVLLKTLILRIFAHAYQINISEKRSSKGNKLVSIYQNHLITFPKECFPFIEKEMLLSKHYEAPGFNEPHNDNPKVTCRCHKSAAQASELFYGISESRFNNLYTNLYERMLFESIGRMKPIDKMYPATSFTYSEKMDQIAKAVRDIERSVKEQGSSKRGRKS